MMNLTRQLLSLWCLVVVLTMITPRTVLATDSLFYFQPVPGKTIGVAPDSWSVERLTQLRVQYGFNAVQLSPDPVKYSNAIAAGFSPNNIMIGFAHGYHEYSVDNFLAGIYYVDEAVEHNCAGQPSAGPIHTPQLLDSIRNYVQTQRPGAIFVSSGYKRCSHVRILGDRVDKIMYSAYKDWYEFTLWNCTVNLGWGDASERPFIEGSADQSNSWTSMKNLFGEKFSMTWIRGRDDEYTTLIPHANALGLNGLWVYHGEPIDTTLLLNFCNAAWQNGWMIRESGVLPVRLASFTGVRTSSGVRLIWRTLGETNNYGFYVQRSVNDGGAFQDLSGAFVAGHGTTIRPQDYSFHDSDVPSGVLRYRLRQIDLDGTPHFSDPILVDLATGIQSVPQEESALRHNYPNPFNPFTTIPFVVNESGHATLVVFDVLGREVARLLDEWIDAGVHSREFDATSLAGGVYICRLTTTNASYSRRLLLLR